MATTRAEREPVLRRGRALELFTIAWNSAEGVVSVLLGLLAGSVALIGFGVDSFIETSSGIVLLWRLQTARDRESAERAEATALRLVGASLFLLSGYIAYDAGVSLISRTPPDPSLPGIVLAAASLIVMPLLAREKRRVASRLNSHALFADAFQTSICTYLSAILLVGLTLNAAFGWWWADPIAALAMLPLIVREGREAWRGERCG